MNYPESVAYLYALGNELKTAKLGLERMQVFWREMGLAESMPPAVHVAGTNGKGSTCAMISAGAQRVCSVGLYTSPHLVSPTERIQVNGQPVKEDEFARAFASVHSLAERLLEAEVIEAHPSYFETVTLMAFLLFSERKVDLAVLEVGLGGRLDATNVVTPELCVITPIDFDHEAWLGKSIESIAFEKAGILKSRVAAVIAPQRDTARKVIAQRASEVGAPLLHVSDAPWELVEIDTYSSAFRFDGELVRCPLAGAHQVENARTAALALRQLGLPLDGIRDARWPGRLELVSRTPEIMLDGAHNPAGARALARYLERFHAGRRIGMIFGAMRDKAFEEVTSILFPLVDELICTAPDQPRALRPGAMLEITPHPNARVAETLGEALALPRHCDVLIITGSLYLVGEARALLVQ